MSSGSAATKMLEHRLKSVTCGVDLKVLSRSKRTDLSARVRKTLFNDLNMMTGSIWRQDWDVQGSEMRE